VVYVVFADDDIALVGERSLAEVNDRLDKWETPVEGTWVENRIHDFGVREQGASQQRNGR